MFEIAESDGETGPAGREERREQALRRGTRDPGQNMQDGPAGCSKIFSKKPMQQTVLIWYTRWYPNAAGM